MNYLTIVEVGIFCADFVKHKGFFSDMAHAMDFVQAHAEKNCVYISRGDNGKVRAVMLAWPIKYADIKDDYDGKWIDVKDFDSLYINLLIVDGSLSKTDSITAIRSMKERVMEQHGEAIKYACYHRRKYGEIFRTASVRYEDKTNGPD